MDDVVIKTRNPDDLIADLEETFSSLRKFSWKLNPAKCIFGVPSEKLLEFIVSNRANPVKITAITDMEAPAIIKDVQKLTGCMAALNKFISQLGERGLPFFKLLKCQDKFQWTTLVQRFTSSRSASQQRVGLQQGDNGRLCTRSAQAGK
jgi:hypothetical protein